MAGEEILKEGRVSTGIYTDNGEFNPLYHRGIPRGPALPRTTSVRQPTDILRFLTIIALTMVIGYLAVVPVLLVLLVL